MKIRIIGSIGSVLGPSVFGSPRIFLRVKLSMANPL